MNDFVHTTLIIPISVCCHREEDYGRWNGFPVSREATSLTIIWRLPIVHDHIKRPSILYFLFFILLSFIFYLLSLIFYHVFLSFIFITYLLSFFLSFMSFIFFSFFLSSIFYLLSFIIYHVSFYNYYIYLFIYQVIHSILSCDRNLIG